MGGADQEHEEHETEQGPSACSTYFAARYKTTGWQQTHTRTHARTGARRPGEGMISCGMSIDWLLACGFTCMYRQETRDACRYLSLLESGSPPCQPPSSTPQYHN